MAWKTLSPFQGFLTRRVSTLSYRWRKLFKSSLISPTRKFLCQHLVGSGRHHGIRFITWKNFSCKAQQNQVFAWLPSRLGAERGDGEGAFLSHRICLYDVLTGRDRLWISAGLTPEASSAPSSLCHGCWEEDGNSSWRKVAQHLKRPFHELTAREDGVFLFFLDLKPH